MKTFKDGDIAPYGISKKAEFPNIKTFFIRLPVSFWKTKHYNIRTDEYDKGWYLIDIVFIIRVGLNYNLIKKED